MFAEPVIQGMFCHSVKTNKLWLFLFFLPLINNRIAHDFRVRYRTVASYAMVTSRMELNFRISGGDDTFSLREIE